MKVTDSQIVKFLALMVAGVLVFSAVLVSLGNLFVPEDGFYRVEGFSTNSQRIFVSKYIRYSSGAYDFQQYAKTFCAKKFPQAVIGGYIHKEYLWYNGETYIEYLTKEKGDKVLEE